MTEPTPLQYLLEGPVRIAKLAIEFLITGSEGSSDVGNGAEALKTSTNKKISQEKTMKCDMPVQTQSGQCKDSVGTRVF